MYLALQCAWTAWLVVSEKFDRKIPAKATQTSAIPSGPYAAVMTLLCSPSNEIRPI